MSIYNYKLHYCIKNYYFNCGVNCVLVSTKYQWWKVTKDINYLTPPQIDLVSLCMKLYMK